MDVRGIDNSQVIARAVPAAQARRRRYRRILLKAHEAAAQVKTIDYLGLDGADDSWPAPHVHGYRQVNRLVDLDIAFQIGLWDGILKNLDVAYLCKLLRQLDGLLGRVEALVGIDRHLKIHPAHFAHGLQPLDHRLLDLALDLDAFESVCERPFNRSLAVFNRQVPHPVIGPHSVAYRTAQQRVYRHLASFAHQVKDRHLKSAVRRSAPHCGQLLSAVVTGGKNILQGQLLGVFAQELGRPCADLFYRLAAPGLAQTRQLGIRIQAHDVLGHLVPPGLGHAFRAVYSPGDRRHHYGPNINRRYFHGMKLSFSSTVSANSANSRAVWSKSSKDAISTGVCM